MSRHVGYYFLNLVWIEDWIFSIICGALYCFCFYADMKCKVHFFTPADNFNTHCMYSYDWRLRSFPGGPNKLSIVKQNQNQEKVTVFQVSIDLFYFPYSTMFPRSIFVTIRKNTMETWNTMAWQLKKKVSSVSQTISTRRWRRLRYF
jgi:hypothetical protein